MIKDILFHGVDPHYATGYGLQMALFAPRLAKAGYNVVISRMQPPPPGLERPNEFEGVPIIGPAGAQRECGLPHLPMQRAFGRAAPDLVITLKDCWTLPAGEFRNHRTLSLCPVDTVTMSVPDREYFTGSAAVPAAVSLHGLSVMRHAGLNPVYIPHGIELAQWAPPDDKRETRDWLGLPPGVFIAGMNAANIAGDGFPSRKGFDEAFAAFAIFRRKHPKALLLCHTTPLTEEGIDLYALRNFHGLDDAVIFPPNGTAVSHADLLSWYQALDVYLAPSYGEGFCIPVAEALACGVPVIATDATALPERVPPGAGWLVRAQNWWNPHHLTHWAIPSVHALAGALARATARRPAPAAVRAAVAQLDADRVFAERWLPVLDYMTAEPPPITISTAARRGAVRTRPRTKDIAVLVPSRGRPASVARLTETVRNTATLATDLWFGFDDDDPALAANLAAARGATVRVRPRMGLAPWTNELAREAIGYTAVVSMGDDHIPITPGWDAQLLAAAGTAGIAYPNDKVRDDICEAVLITTNIVDALGWMVPPGFNHWFIDNCWHDLGKQAGCLSYCPDIIVEHHHHSHHKTVTYDATYSQAWRKLAGDKMLYDQWRDTRLAADAAIVAGVAHA